MINTPVWVSTVTAPVTTDEPIVLFLRGILVRSNEQIH
nr:MAG TPA: hypothetical protein [Caudoviricetes sp.]